MNVADNGIAPDIHSPIAPHMQSDGAEKIDLALRGVLADQVPPAH